MSVPESSSDAGAVVVAILTYRRPDVLVRAATAVLEQIDDVDLECVLTIVDNDPDASAASVVRSLQPAVRYVHEPTPGIPAARNAALDASSSASAIVFIDDDEVPEPGWLQNLLDAWRQWQCDAVAGPNRRSLDGSEDPWVTASGFFGVRQRSNGAVIPGAATSNLLLDLTSLRRFGLRFDQRFATTGGSDTLITRQLTKAGGVIKWCSTAVTREPAPPERTTREWVLARERRVGNTWSRVHLVLAGGGAGRVKTSAWLLALACKLSLAGWSRRGAGVFSRRLEHRAVGECEVARARGVIAGVFGGAVEEYRRGTAD